MQPHLYLGNKEEAERGKERGEEVQRDGREGMGKEGGGIKSEESVGRGGGGRGRVGERVDNTSVS